MCSRSTTHCLAHACTIHCIGGFTLKWIRRVTWEVRSNWRDLGIELEVDSGTLKVLLCSLYIHIAGSRTPDHVLGRLVRKTTCTVANVHAGLWCLIMGILYA